MDRDQRQTASWLVALVLVFVVGILVGQQFCVEAPQEPPPPDCPPPAQPQIIEFCPPPADDPEPEPEPPEFDEAQQDELPDSPPPVEPDERRRLLGWARDQSTTLEACPRDLGETHRLGVTLEIEDRDVVDVSLSTDDQQLTAEFEACLHRRIGDWQLPEDLTPPGRELFFHLTL